MGSSRGPGSAYLCLLDDQYINVYLDALGVASIREL